MRRVRGELRIIGGRLRGHRFAVPDAVGLRPTPDRVRETLFNWLAPVMPGARCLDLFAGSGALGLEAASRGAAEVVMVERADALVRQLRTHIERLSLASVRIIQADALSWLEGSDAPFDIVFLDPPYDADLWAPAIAGLLRGAWLNPGGRLYLEAPRSVGLPLLPPEWDLARDKTAGQIRYGLAICGAHPEAARSRPLVDRARATESRR
ncbi:MAG: 16S rRNA (guanine(966)-N(2))-methyltransferase RsmD [Sphingobacteriia bacterium]|nr:16S rRNA (guanine(966)-N(2))-methyltransferase RsmD [Sphingobacteriia bacterium]NCC38655.1 16S rRNA (guanine(966)-N(2))-methyltransferase RsmD [Gammaproteobacteria bacterium]